MAERSPDPKDVRVSMVDKGWSESPPQVRDLPPPPPLPKDKDLPPPPPLPGQGPPSSQRSAEEITRDETPDISEIENSEPPTQSTPRELPPYEESSRDLLVTRVDDQMQARANAMTAEPEELVEKTVVAPPVPVAPVATPAPRSAPVQSVATAAPKPTLPQPLVPVARPTLPQPLVPVAKPAPERFDATPARKPALPQSAPTPAAKPAPPEPVPATQSSPSTADAPPPPPLPPSAAGAAPRTFASPVVVPSVSSVVPTEPVAPKPGGLAPKVATAAWPIPAPFVAPVAASAAQSPGASGSKPVAMPDAPFTTAPSAITMVDRYGPVSTLRDALLGRVRVFNRPIPLWAVLAPVLVLTAMLAALTVGIAGDSANPSPEAAPAPSGAAESGGAERASGAPSGERKPVSLLEKAAAGEPTALSTLEQKKPKDLATEEALAIARGKVAQDVAAVKKLRERLSADPGLAKDKKLIGDLLRFAHGRETSQDALATMAALPGPLSADLVYEVWTGTAQRSEATELARAILLGKDVRPKASPALGVALDLREATTCEESLALLSRAIEQGDKRALVPINRLARRTGCGPNKKQDCYPCLREGDLLKRAFNAVRTRREPELLR